MHILWRFSENTNSVLTNSIKAQFTSYTDFWLTLLAHIYPPTISGVQHIDIQLSNHTRNNSSIYEAIHTLFRPKISMSFLQNISGKTNAHLFLMQTDPTSMVLRHNSYLQTQRDNYAEPQLSYRNSFRHTTSLKPFEDHIVYLFSITRQKIWTHRNDIEKRKTDFSEKQIITSIKRSIRHRLSLEQACTTYATCGPRDLFFRPARTQLQKMLQKPDFG